MSKVKCSVCGVLKLKTVVGEKRDGNQIRRVYADETGAIWRSAFCHPCGLARNQQYKKKHYKRKRGEDEGEDGPSRFKTKPVTKRICRKCTKPLSVSYYFYHPMCRPTTEYMDWSETVTNTGRALSDG